MSSIHQGSFAATLMVAAWRTSHLGRIVMNVMSASRTQRFNEVVADGLNRGLSFTAACDQALMSRAIVAPGDEDTPFFYCSNCDVVLASTQIVVDCYDTPDGGSYTLEACPMCTYAVHRHDPQNPVAPCNLIAGEPFPLDQLPY
jgi:hypothetical protein